MRINRCKISLFIWGVLLLFPACQDTIVPDKGGGIEEEEGAAELVPITLDLKDIFGNTTYSLTPGPDAAGTSAEDSIKDVSVYIFKASNGECEKIFAVPGSSLPIGPELITTGVKHIVAIANIDGNITGLPSVGDESLINFSTMLRKVSDEKFVSPPASPFLMTGVKTNISVPKRTEAQAFPIVIDIARTVSKVTFKFTKSGNAASKNIVIQKLTLVRGADRVGLFETPNPNPTQYDLQRESYSFNSYNASDPPGTVPVTGDFCLALDTFYTYENLAGRTKSQATYFEVEATVGGSSITRSCKVYLAENPISSAPNDTIWDVKRNYWYDVRLNIIDPGFDSVYVTVNVSKWNVANPQEVTPGSGYEITEMAQPFKLVKYYTSADMALDQRVAAIYKHSKGASWFKLQVSKDASWNLNFKQPLTGEERFSIDSGRSWAASLTGIGDDNPHLIYVYRPYVENGEPNYGPSFTLTVGGQDVRDFVVQPRDSLPVPTNSYILRPQLSGTPANETRVYIPLKEVYRYWEDCIYENGDSIPEGATPADVTAALLWQDRPMNTLVVQNLNIINAGQRDQAYLSAEAGSVQGNAVVVFKVNGTVYWTFHLWVTEYNPYEAAGQKSYQGNIFMDRNLGALNNQYDAQGEARGLFYQFGRSTPFPRGANWDLSPALLLYYPSSVSFTSSSFPLVVANPITSSLPPFEAIPASLQNPTIFYTNDITWPLSEESSYLWYTKEGNKTAFDPCPEGWRIPKPDNTSPWNGLETSNFLTNQPGYGNGRYHVSAGYYPYAGRMSVQSSSVLITQSGTNGNYWSSRASSGGRWTLFFNNTMVNFASELHEDRGASVRCVVDTNYLQNMPGGGLFRK